MEQRNAQPLERGNLDQEEIFLFLLMTVCSIGIISIYYQCSRLRAVSHRRRFNKSIEEATILTSRNGNHSKSPFWKRLLFTSSKKKLLKHHHGLEGQLELENVRTQLRTVSKAQHQALEAELMELRAVRSEVKAQLNGLSRLVANAKKNSSSSPLSQEDKSKAS